MYAKSTSGLITPSIAAKSTLRLLAYPHNALHSRELIPASADTLPWRYRLEPDAVQASIPIHFLHHLQYQHRATNCVKLQSDATAENGYTMGATKANGPTLACQFPHLGATMCCGTTTESWLQNLNTVDSR